ncbi:putative transposon Ty3-I Gag-Pol polyprotein [Apostichopus japonicus]|uniref:Putative transposon Ty3-I Gag-Pol polyprotein n=1 Tax=Stichopus japonicus TaxID=307972 RepID=A0A2G8KFW2_STIJA|nr:putative transposon Ty3-I Gag-Pol polyprotein [Apostichopus japonicus]
MNLPVPLMVVGFGDEDVNVLGFVSAVVKIRERSSLVAFLIIDGQTSGRSEQYPILLGCNALKVLVGANEPVKEGESVELAARCMEFSDVTQVCEAEIVIGEEREEVAACQNRSEGSLVGKSVAALAEGQGGELLTKSEDRIEGSQAVSLEGTPSSDTEVYMLADETMVELPWGVELPALERNKVDRVAVLLHDNLKAFSRDDLDLGFCDLIPHEIKLTDQCTPIRLPYRRIPPTQTIEIKELLQGLLEKNIIRRSSSPYASPVVIVPKKDGSLRLCVDYRRLNSITIKDSFPLPRIDETLEALGGSKYFSSLDLSHGYFQVAVHTESVEKTAFRGRGDYMSSPGCLKDFVTVPALSKESWNLFLEMSTYPNWYCI